MENFNIEDAYQRYCVRMHEHMEKYEVDEDELLSFEEFEKEWLDRQGDWEDMTL